MATTIDASICRSDKAGKKPLDLGVLGLEATKQALNEKFGPALPPQVPIAQKDDEGFTSSNWGKETADEKEKKAKFVREARSRQMDIYAMPRKVASVVIRLFLFQRISRSFAARYLGEKNAKYAIWGAIFVWIWHKWGAWTPLNKHLKAPVMRFPLIGSMIQMALNKSRFHNYMTDSIAKMGFMTSEITIPGAAYVAVMDARDREYVLKTNFRNYLKNRENDMGSFENVLGDVTGRGIFSTDKIEWQDSRKIASHMFSGASLKAKMEDVFNHHADMVVELLEKRVAGTGKAVDMVSRYKLTKCFSQHQLTGQ